MALHLKLKPHSHLSPLPSLRLLSSASSCPPPPPPPPSDESSPEPQSQSNPSVSSHFSDIKQRLGSHASPLRRIPTDPLPPPSLYPPPQSQSSTVSLDQIRKRLADFKASSSTSSSSTLSSSSAPPRFQDLFKSNLQNNPPGSAAAPSFETIRQNLQQRRSPNAFLSLKSLQESIRGKDPEPGEQTSVIGSGGHLPESIFGREARERKVEGREKESEGLKTQFIKDYTKQELGEKLVKLRPKGGEKEGLSLNELNQRLVKLRKMEEANKPDGGAFDVIRESIRNIHSGEESKISLCLLHFPFLYLLMFSE